MTVLEQHKAPSLVAGSGRDTAVLDLATARLDIDATFTQFLDAKEESAPGPEISGLISVMRSFAAGGKRLRPLLCVSGWYAGGGTGDTTAVLRTAVGLELFQTFALVHDDVMDASDLRRGEPSAHRMLAAAYPGGGRHAKADAHGMGAAVLLGDLALVWSDELLHQALDETRLKRVLPIVDTMRNEVVYGQFLDLLAAGTPSGDLEAAMRVARYKTAKYTVERPLHIGAALAGAGPQVLEACTAFALPLGEAFQLRDDLLGVFGDPAQTGKPVLDDLRGGKATVLMALAVQRASTAERDELQGLVGTPDLDEAGAERVRTVLETTGARQSVEEMIGARLETALAALDHASFPPAATAALREIAQAATARQA